MDTIFGQVGLVLYFLLKTKSCEENPFINDTLDCNYDTNGIQFKASTRYITSNYNYSYQICNPTQKNGYCYKPSYPVEESGICDYNIGTVVCIIPIKSKFHSKSRFYKFAIRVNAKSDEHLGGFNTSLMAFDRFTKCQCNCHSFNRGFDIVHSQISNGSYQVSIQNETTSSLITTSYCFSWKDRLQSTECGFEELQNSKQSNHCKKKEAKSKIIKFNVDDPCKNYTICMHKSSIRCKKSYQYCKPFSFYPLTNWPQINLKCLNLDGKGMISWTASKPISYSLSLTIIIGLIVGFVLLLIIGFVLCVLFYYKGFCRRTLVNNETDIFDQTEAEMALVSPTAEYAEVENEVLETNYDHLHEEDAC